LDLVRALALALVSRFTFLEPDNARQQDDTKIHNDDQVWQGSKIVVGAEVFTVQYCTGQYPE